MARVQTVAGYPVKQYTSPNRGGKMSDHRGVVLHIAEGGYQGTISWQMNPDQKLSDGTPYNTCSTWIVGKNIGEVAQMVDSDDIAWCQRAGSKTWLSIELAGFHTESGVPSDWQRRACAELLLWSHRRYGHPLAIANSDADRGLGHHSMDREWAGVEWGHEQCPGPYVIAAKLDILARAKGESTPEDGDTMFCKYGETKSYKVRYLQRRLDRLGYKDVAGQRLTLDGDYGDKTAAALKTYVPQSTDDGKDYNDYAMEVLDELLRWRAAVVAVDAHEANHPAGDGGIAPGSTVRFTGTLDKVL